MMKKKFRKIHLWLSIPFGLIISLICFTGALLVYEDQITRLTNHDLYYVENPGKHTLPIGNLVETVAAQLPEGISVKGVTVYPQPDRTYQVNLSAPRGAAVYVDPYTGIIKGECQRSPFFRTVFSLHRWLLDSPPSDDGIFWGKRITGVTVLLFVFILLSGVVLWWPRSRQDLTNGVKIALHKGKTRFWYDLHAVGGVYALLLVLVMALTGLTWSFDWYRSGFYKIFGVEMMTSTSADKKKSQKGEPGKSENLQSATTNRFTYWQQVYDQLAKENPENLKIEISNGTASVSNNRLGNTRGADRYSFDPRSGKITGASPYKTMDNSGKIRGWIYSVHVGSWGGSVTRILWFLTALLGASLPLTGYYLWIKRLYRKKKKRIVH